MREHDLSREQRCLSAQSLFTILIPDQFPNHEQDQQDEEEVQRQIEDHHFASKRRSQTLRLEQKL